MHAQLLIDDIVRQTTVFIARLSTQRDGGSPLARIANEVFVHLVEELEAQGARDEKALADMFGMALRSYRSKVQRLGESKTTPGTTLWSALQTFVAEKGSIALADAVARFHADDEGSVAGLLDDLAQGGLVVRSDLGAGYQYRLATREELETGAVAAPLSAESVEALVWVQVYREGSADRARIGQLVPLPPHIVDAALDALMADGRIRLDGAGSVPRFSAAEVLIPIGEVAGWEAAVVDHHRAVLSAIAAKVAMGSSGSSSSDETGGTTLTFDLWPGHPREAEVRQLLRQTRATVLPLWEELSEISRPVNEQDVYQVHFYCGQYVVEEEDA